MALVIQLLATAALGLTSPQPVDTEDAIEQLDEDVCGGELAVPRVSEACADWVNKCCYAALWPYIDVSAGPNGERVYVFGLEDNFRIGTNVAALDPATGKTLWNTSVDNFVSAMAVSSDESRLFISATRGSLISVIAFDAESGEQLWVARHEAATGIPYDIVVGPDSNRVYVTGETSHGEPTWIDVTTVAFDATTGSELWARNHDGPSDVGGDVGRSIDVSPDGSHVFVSGEEQNATTHTDWVTIAYNASTGEQAWKHRLDVGGEDPGIDKPNDVAVHPDGGLVFVSGFAYYDDIGAGAYAMTTVAYHTTNGKQAWSARYVQSSGAEALAVSPDGSSVFVTGGSGEVYTVAYNASTGTQQWDVDEFSLSLPMQGAYTKGRDVVVSPSSATVYVSGVDWRWNDFPLQGENNGDYITLAYDVSNGSRQWMARYNAGDPVFPGGDWPFGIDVAPDGSRVYVAGQSDDPVAARVVATVAYNASGPNPVIGPLVEGDGV